ncbi:MAG: AsnC family transcriptional regulator [Anaerolineae bacterium]|nr:AsnC family transcriptional regulator [Anaerolineae bacterium]
MDALDRRLLNEIQKAVPLVSRPFRALGRTLGLPEAEVLRRVRRLKQEDIIRQIGPIFSSRRLGYQSTLAAFRVEPERLDEVARVVSAHPGVSHNYSRDHAYNLWFTLTLPPNRDLEQAIARLAAATGADDYLNLPSVRLFKIGVHFDLSNGSKETPEGKAQTGSPGADSTAEPLVSDTPLTDFERDIVRVVQGDLPLVQQPFQEAALKLSVTEAALLDGLHELHQRGVMRRLSAVLRHRRAGFTANGMGCWVVPNERIVEGGQAAAGFSAVSHCYQRPAYPPRWPYNLFTMVHGQSRQEVEGIVRQIADRIDPVDYIILYSQREYKKKRVRYFREA